MSSPASFPAPPDDGEPLRRPVLLSWLTPEMVQTGADELGVTLTFDLGGLVVSGRLLPRDADALGLRLQVQAASAMQSEVLKGIH